MRALAWMIGALGLAGALFAAEPARTPLGPSPPVVPGYTMRFPRDFGAHPQFRLEWWYLTGWLTGADGESLGFQITFFRTRTGIDDGNPSAFAARQLLIAHCALSDPKHAGLWHDQRIRREGLGLAEASNEDTAVWMDDWRLERRDGAYQAHIDAQDFALQLTLAPTQSPLLEGDHGFSRKAPAAEAASYYYSEPQLTVQGQVVRAGRAVAVHGVGWLDHEWSSAYLDPAAVGWDWVGLNLDDGGAVMAFRIRDGNGMPLWAGGSWRDAHGSTRVFAPEQILFEPQRRWHSPRTGVSYPVSWQLRLGEHSLRIEPLLDDQENDARASSGALYWEGAVRVTDHDQRVAGRGYLELTGYDRPLSLR